MDKVTVQLTARQAEALCDYMTQLIALSMLTLDDMSLQERSEVISLFQKITTNVRRWFPEEARNGNWFEDYGGEAYITHWWKGDYDD